MKYTPGPLVGELSGKQGNTVASHNRFGPYFRNRVLPIGTVTPPSQAARNNFAAISAFWRTMTSAQRNAWIAEAVNYTYVDRLGRNYQPTGQQFFVGVNRNRYKYDNTNAPTATVPSAAAPPAIASATITCAVA